MRMPDVKTDRLLIRPCILDDLEAIYQILDIELSDVDILGSDGALSQDEREKWLRWSVLNYEQLANLYQPPLGDRAVVLRKSGEVIGACGYAPSLNAFGQLPAFGGPEGVPIPSLNSIEVGLYYALSPRHQGKGYATEAAQALVDYAFQELRLKRIVATTYDNEGSIGVMRWLGMRIERNPHSEPPWLQVVGILENLSGSGNLRAG